MICSLKLKKDVPIFKNLIWILCFWFWSYTSSKLLFHVLFLCNLRVFFSCIGNVLLTILVSYYWLIHFGYSANYNTRGAFLIIFFICSDLLNCLRCVGIIVITTKQRTWLKQPQSHFHYAVSLKSHQFSLFWCILCGATSDILSSNENISNTTRVFRLSFHFLWLS